MHVDLAFGKSGYRLELPEGRDYRVLEARSATALPDAPGAVAAALDSPIGSPPLADLARGRKSAAISVCDITRPAPNGIVLPPLLARLESAGIERENITILIATGLHRPAPPAEIVEIVGPEIASRYRVVNHDARQLQTHRHLGSTRSGTPVYIDERFVSAELHITLGFIEPHLMLGYSGGRKLIAPGLAAQETIKVLHSSKFMRDVRAAEGSIEDNPLHRELLEISGMARHDFLVDVALSRTIINQPGARRAIAEVFAGAPLAAHPAGVRFVSEVMLEVLERPADLVITTGAGYPLDLTYYQSIKGITAASHLVKRGGRILLLAACEEGVGAGEFGQMVREHGSGPEFLHHIDGKPVVIDQWQLEKLALAADRAELLFHLPGLPASYHEKLWGRSLPSPETAIAAALDGLPNDAVVAVIPEGPYVLARANAGEPALV
jgi:nickel-dependent lactate racemase